MIKYTDIIDFATKRWYNIINNFMQLDINMIKAVTNN